LAVIGRHIGMATSGPGLPRVRRAALAAVCSAIVATPVAAAAVTTPGSGALTICRDWLVYESCTTYHKVDLPDRITVGDRIELTYGTNPKDYVFHVSRINHDGDRCVILSENSGRGGKGERIEVTPCGAAAAP
jgi:hypothetical protein